MRFYSVEAAFEPQTAVPPWDLSFLDCRPPFHNKNKICIGISADFVFYRWKRSFQGEVSLMPFWTRGNRSCLTVLYVRLSSFNRSDIHSFMCRIDRLVGFHSLWETGHWAVFNIYIASLVLLESFRAQVWEICTRAWDLNLNRQEGFFLLPFHLNHPNSIWGWKFFWDS